MCDSLDLALKQPGLCVFDVFVAHRTESFKKKIKKNGIIVKFIPGGCTRDLQPLDVLGNCQFKDLVKKKRFVTWYATEIKKKKN